MVRFERFLLPLTDWTLLLLLPGVQGLLSSHLSPLSSPLLSSPSLPTGVSEHGCEENPALPLSPLLPSPLLSISPLMLQSMAVKRNLLLLSNSTLHPTGEAEGQPSNLSIRNF